MKIKNIIHKPKFNSRNYWEWRYEKGGNSGSGSYGRLAEFKARIINDFISRNSVQTVIEFGCGDGNQLTLANYPSYIGLDVSSTVIKKCEEKFRSDKTKSFFLYSGEAFVDNKGIFKCQLSLSLDVIYHLVEQEAYESHLKHLFSSSQQYVILYSSNTNTPSASVHEKHREFVPDIQRLMKGWKIIDIIKNEYKPANWEDESGSIADFYIYEKI